MTKGTLQIDYEKLVIENLELNERIKDLETALEGIWPFIEEDFPKGTGNNHGTCATDSYVLAARQIEQARKG